MQENSRLEILLGELSHFHPHYGDRLAAHLPMVLIALDKMGASEQKLESFFKNAVQGLEPVVAAHPKPIERIEQGLGDSSRYGDYLHFYQQRLDQSEVASVLRDSLPILLPGLAASAFHALIRLAYAVDAQNNQEVAIALAYWSAEYQAFDLCDSKADESLATILARLAPLGASYEFAPGIIVDRMAEIGVLLKRESAVYLPVNLAFDDIRSLCLQAFLIQDDFTLLHTVTGCQAFSMLLPYVTDDHAALQSLWRAIVVAYLSTGLTFDSTKEELLKCGVDFEALRLKALESDDSHQIKLVYSCMQEYEKYKDDRYFTIAERALK